MRKVFFPLFVAAILFLLLLDPSRYFASVQGGLLLFVSAVLPSMLPYFFFTKILTGTGCVGGLSETVGKPVSKLYRISPIAAYPLVMSLLSGYPIGARVVADLYEKGLMDREDALRASSFSSTSGSMFVLGSVGAVILKDAVAGVVILLSHYIGALVNGLLYRGRRGERRLVAIPSLRPAESLISDAMYESVLSLALVGGFIALANLLGDMAADLLGKVGLGAFVTESVFGGLFYGVFEVTRGCVEFSRLGIGRVWKAALCCLVISFGGVSVILQSLAFLGKTGIKKARFLLMKTTQALFSAALCIGAGFLFLR